MLEVGHQLRVLSNKDPDRSGVHDIELVGADGACYISTALKVSSRFGWFSRQGTEHILIRESPFEVLTDKIKELSSGLLEGSYHIDLSSGTYWLFMQSDEYLTVEHIENSPATHAIPKVIKSQRFTRRGDALEAKEFPPIIARMCREFTESGKLRVPTEAMAT